MDLLHGVLNTKWTSEQLSMVWNLDWASQCKAHGKKIPLIGQSNLPGLSMNNGLIIDSNCSEFNDKLIRDPLKRTIFISSEMCHMHCFVSVDMIYNQYATCWLESSIEN
eukprot:TRINITY_DN33572_c2_g1_i1.p1 TRINITY_DN33572_c2_g1~~TRINITY_DN33572_c2_g1_i1.p1  ORF type:complete len:109 (-),score=7.68 TRINITY_DN33572_c2_g1_i1:357-683(-)